MSEHIYKRIPAEHMEIILPKKLKEKLSITAKENYRTIQNEVVYILLEYINKRDKCNRDLTNFLKQFIEEKKRRKIFKNKTPELILIKKKNGGR